MLKAESRDSEVLVRETIARTRLFADWPAATIDALNRASMVRCYDNGEAVLHRGQATGFMVVVADGVLSVQRTLPSGKVGVFDFLLPGQSTGHISMLDGLPPAFDIIAKGRTTVVLIPQEAVQAAIGRDPDRLSDIIQFLCRRTRLDYEGLHNAILPTLRVRIAKLLIYWARGAQEPNGEGFRVPVAISQDEMASLLGCSRQTVNREIAALTRDGILAPNYRQLTVIDVPALIALIENEDPRMQDVYQALFARPKHMFSATD